MTLRPPGLLLVFVLAILPGCSTDERGGSATGPTEGQTEPEEAPPLPGSSIVLITLDTTRIETLGVYGGPAWNTPNMDQLARNGIRFDQARVAAPITLPSHAAMLTGTYPFQNGVRDNGTFILPDAALTLTEELAAAGYFTAAVMGSQVLHSSYGLAQGFQVYSDVPTRNLRTAGGTEERMAAEIVTEGMRILEQVPTGMPFFLWLHFFDPHWPYSPPAAVMARLPPAAQPDQAPDHNSATRRRYYGEVASVDRQVGRLLQALKARGEVVDEILFAIVSDHGEGLGQHGEASHAYQIYDSTMRIPMILHHGALEKGLVIHQPVSTIDLAPTLLSLVGRDPPPAMSGMDLTPLLSPTAGGQSSPRPIYFETSASWFSCGWSPLYGVVEGPWKTIVSRQPEVFRYLEDANEEHDLAAAHPEVIARAVAYLDDLAGLTTTSTRRTLSQEDAAALEALGYLVDDENQGDQPVSATVEQQVPPGWLPEGARLPRDGLPLKQNLNQAKLLIQSGRVEEGLTLLKRMVEMEPNNVMYLALAGALLTSAGRPEEAIPILERAVARGSSYEASSSLAGSLNQLGRRTEAIQVLLGSIRQFPYQLLPRISVAQILIENGEPVAAIPHLVYFLENFQGDAQVRQDAQHMLENARQAAASD
ncbi:MAG: sulfatase-like hydrolase/transferase [Acidobacteria bacterium]|nr:sulfatase-like hydrolase/transferase [Acidobacteriota bacterium]